MSTKFGRQILCVFVVHNAASIAFLLKECWRYEDLIGGFEFSIKKSLTWALLGLELVWTMVGVAALRNRKLFSPDPAIENENE